MSRGAPLRFLALVLLLWVGARAAMLWRWAGEAARERPGGALAAPVATLVPARRPIAPAPTRRPPLASTVANRAPAAPRLASLPAPATPVALPVVEAPPLGAEMVPQQPPPAAPLAGPPPGRRLSGSAWLIARQGLAGPLSPAGGELGNSQAGVRLAYALDRRGRLRLHARLSTPLGGPGQEGAAGIEWQPTRLPIRLIAEQRVALDGGAASAPALGVVAGLGPVGWRGWRLEGYGQAGYVARAGGLAYADGALRATRPVAAGGTVSLGAGAWGAAQPGAARLDIGPVIAWQLRAGRQPLRLTLEWRERITGTAAPRSGPALSLGTDF